MANGEPKCSGAGTATRHSSSAGCMCYTNCREHYWLLFRILKKPCCWDCFPVLLASVARTSFWAQKLWKSSKRVIQDLKNRGGRMEVFCYCLKNFL